MTTRGFRRGVRERQRGQAVLALLLLLGVALSLFVYNAIDPASATVRREAKTAATMIAVREALIGWSVARTSPTDGTNARPGELPCPDINPLDGFEDGNCAAGALGRVPWKTLGIPEPKDETGETLWYAIAGPFRIWNTNPNPINSDTRGNLTVYQNSAAATLTTQAVAVIFTAGAPLGNQIRDGAAVLCPTTGTSIPRNICAANYLETAATINNATVGGPFIAAQGSTTFNDKLLVVTSAELITVLEQRVARELIALLRAYRTAPGNTCNCYTWPDGDFTNEGDNDVFRGWLPIGEADPHFWSDVGITIPTWLANNDWWKVFYYAVAPDETQNKSGGTLTVDGAAAHVALITPGPATGGTPRAYWTGYLEDAENNDHANHVYVTPSSTAYARDRLYVIRP